jgi:SH3-like domain-containing protein
VHFLRFLVILFLFNLSICRLVDAANVTTDKRNVDAEGSTYSRGFIRLDGEIVSGDSQKLKSAAELMGSDFAFELNSGGGDFAEGLKIALLFRELGKQTIIRHGDSCLSACAIAFLGGAEQIDEGTVPWRTVEIGAKLSFHAPYAELGKQNVDVGDLVRAITKVTIELTVKFEEFGVPNSVIPKLMLDDANHSLFDATEIEVLNLLGVRVDGLKLRNLQITKSMVANICQIGWVLDDRQLASSPKGYAANSYAFGSSEISLVRDKKGQLVASIKAVNDYEGSAQICLVDKSGGASICRIGEDNKITEDCKFLADGIEGFLLMVPPKTKLKAFETVLDKYRSVEQNLFDGTDVTGADVTGNASEEVNQSSPNRGNLVVCNRKSAKSNVRSGPNSKNYPVLFELVNNTPVTVVGSENNPETGHPWTKIDVNGTAGFIDSDSISSSCNVEAASASNVQNAVVCNPKSQFTNVRSGPNSKQFPVLFKLENKNSIAVVGTAANPETGHVWKRIVVDNQEGFIDSDYVAISCNLSLSETVNPVTVVICNQEASITNLRSGPNSQMFPVIEAMENGKTVEVLDQVSNPVTGHPWLKVKVGGNTGFVDLEKIAGSC